MAAEVLLLNWLQVSYGDLFVLVGPLIEVHPEDSQANDPRAGLAVLVRSARELTANPRPEDLRMVAEVSDSTISFDLKVKALLYARAGIGEYWVGELF